MKVWTVAPLERSSLSVTQPGRPCTTLAAASPSPAALAVWRSVMRSAPLPLSASSEIGDALNPPAVILSTNSAAGSEPSPTKERSSSVVHQVVMLCLASSDVISRTSLPFFLDPGGRRRLYGVASPDQARPSSRRAAAQAG